MPQGEVRPCVDPHPETEPPRKDQEGSFNKNMAAPGTVLVLVLVEKLAPNTKPSEEDSFHSLIHGPRWRSEDHMGLGLARSFGPLIDLLDRSVEFITLPLNSNCKASPTSKKPAV